MSPRFALTGIGTLLGLLVLLGATGHTEAALPAPAASSAAELRQQIDATPARDRERMIELARQGLAVPLAPGEKIWFLDRMASEQLRLRRWADALTTARDGLATAVVGTAGYVRFADLEAQALQGLGRHEDSLKAWDDRVAPHLPPLLRSVDPMDRRRALDAQRTRGMALVGLKRHGEAMELLTQVLRGFDALKDPRGQAETLHVIASLRSTTGDLSEALRAEQQAIDTAQRGQVPGVLPRLHSLMSYLQATAGNSEAQLHELAAAHASAIEEGDPYVQGVVMFNQSDVAMQRGDWAQSLRLSESARPIFLAIGDLNMADLCLANQGIALNRTGHPEGIALIRRAFDALAGRPGQEVTLAAIQKALAEELAFNRSFELAYAAQLEYQRRRDALHQADNQKRIAEAEAAYQADRRQRQIESLEHEHVEQKRYRWLWTLVGLLGVAAAAVVAISRIYLKRAYRTMHDMALEDPLTRLHNRRYLASRIETELAQLRRERHQAVLTPAAANTGADAGAAFLLIDLDHFKVVNDTHGHAAGDEVLRQASALLRSLVRQTDMIVRWGGEEFLVFARLASRGDASELAERICSRMAAHAFDIGTGTPLHRSCSVGFACYPFATQGSERAALPSWEHMTSLADQCLYAAKANGRNLWVGIQYTDGMPPANAQTDARDGLARGQFTLLHRPGRDLRWPPREPGPAAAHGHAAEDGLAPAASGSGDTPPTGP